MMINDFKIYFTRLLSCQSNGLGLSFGQIKKSSGKFNVDSMVCKIIDLPFPKIKSFNIILFKHKFSGYTQQYHKIIKHRRMPYADHTHQETFVFASFSNLSRILSSPFLSTIQKCVSLRTDSIITDINTSLLVLSYHTYIHTHTYTYSCKMLRDASCLMHSHPA